jgi:hypothetical protein
MASDPPPLPPETPPSPIMARLGIGGIVMVIAAVIGIIATFLPLVSYSMTAFGVTQSGSGGKPVNDWRGVLDLLCYLAVIVLAVLLVVGSRTAVKGLCWGAIGVGAFALLMALLLLFATMSSTNTQISGNAPGLGSMGVSGGSSPALGTILNLLAAAAVAAGAVLKAREEKLF